MKQVIITGITQLGGQDYILVHTVTTDTYESKTYKAPLRDYGFLQLCMTCGIIIGL